MTATEVDGVAVVGDRPTAAPNGFRGHSDKVVMWEQTRTLTLADGRTTYGCVHCDYTSDNPRSIRPHLNKHRMAKASPGATSLAELISGLADIERVTRERDEWKARAQKAEKALRTLRDALGAVQ